MVLIVPNVAVITHRNMYLVTEELAELQKEITKLQDKIDSTIDSRRHTDLKMSKLDRKVKMDKAIAIDQHHQKVREFVRIRFPCPGSTLPL